MVQSNRTCSVSLRGGLVSLIKVSCVSTLFVSAQGAQNESCQPLMVDSSHDLAQTAQLEMGAVCLRLPEGENTNLSLRLDLQMSAAQGDMQCRLAKNTPYNIEFSNKEVNDRLAEGNDVAAATFLINATDIYDEVCTRGDQEYMIIGLATIACEESVSSTSAKEVTSNKLGSLSKSRHLSATQERRQNIWRNAFQFVTSSFSRRDSQELALEEASEFSNTRTFMSYYEFTVRCSDLGQDGAEYHLVRTRKPKFHLRKSIGKQRKEWQPNEVQKENQQELLADLQWSKKNGQE